MEVMVALGAGCLLVRLGMALYGAGLIRSKNSAGALMRHVGDLNFSVLLKMLSSLRAHRTAAFLPAATWRSP